MGKSMVNYYNILNKINNVQLFLNYQKVCIAKKFTVVGKLQYFNFSLPKKVFHLYYNKSIVYLLSRFSNIALISNILGQRLLH